MPVADPLLRAVLEGAIPFALPLRRRFRGLDVREGMLLRGPQGWGEFAPFDDYSDRAASRWLDSAIEAAFAEFTRILQEGAPDDAAAAYWEQGWAARSALSRAPD